MTRTARRLGSALLLCAGVLAWGTRPPPRPDPAPGGLFGGTAVVAWSAGYRVSFFGLEHLHPIRLDKADAAAQALRDRGLVPAEGFSVPGEVSDEDLRRVHPADHLARLEDPVVLGEALELSLPAWVPRSVLRRRVLGPFRRQTQGTVVAARGALETGLGVNLGGGFHHARATLAHGFCVYADVAVAVSVLRQEGFTGHVFVVDTDAHQGDGNHSVFAGDPTVTSVSLHQEGIFPLPRVPGDVDVDLPAGTDDAAYRTALQRVLDDAPPDAALVVHVAGADVLADDPLASLGLSIAGLVQRDLTVAHWAWDRDLPVLHLLAGGYGPSAPEAQAASVAALVQAHSQRVRD